MSFVLKKPVSENKLRAEVQSQEISAAFNALESSINAEATARANFDAELSLNIQNLQLNFSSETAALAASDTLIFSALQNTAATLTASDTFIINLLNSETALRETSEGQLRSEFYTEIDTEKTARTQADEDLKVALLAAIGDSEAAQAICDDNLRAQIASETAMRNAALITLQNAINSETAIRTSEDSRILGSVNAEAAARANADDALSNNFSAALNTETNNRNAALNALKGEINATLAASLNDFTKSAHGFVPVPPDSATEQILVANKAQNLYGWRSVTSSSVYINDLPSQFGTLTFNNTTQTPAFLNYDTNKLTIGGTTSAINAGTYTATFTPKDLYVWGSDNTQSTKNVQWKIDVLYLPKPEATQTEFDYTGNSITLPVNNYNSTYINRANYTKTATGNYTATFTLKSTSNTKWEDGSTGTVSIPWSIKRQALSAELSGSFAQATPLTFNGNSQSVTPTSFNATYHTLGGTYQATNAGSYTASVSPKAAYTWNDGTTDAKSFQWTIEPAALAAPFADTLSFTYDGEVHSLQIQNYDSSLMTQNGTVTASAAGDYSVTYSLKNKTNYTWEDGSTDDVIIQWSIGTQLLAKPKATTTSFTYSGSAKNLTVSNFDSDYMTESGTKTATDAGDYSVTYSLKDTSKAKWADGSTADVTISWTINRKKLTATQSNVILKNDTFTYNFSDQTVAFTNFSNTYHEKTGTETATAAGTYHVYITPKNNYCWNDGTYAAKDLAWTINPLILGELTATAQTYDGTLKTVELLVGGQTPTQTYFTVISGKTATNAGDYRAYVRLVDLANLRFSDGTITARYVDWTINRKTLTAAQSTFAQDGSLTYNAAAQSVSITNFDSTVHVASSTTSATNAGTYTANIDPKSNFCWSDGSTDTKIVTWTINQKTVDKPTAAETDFTYDGEIHALQISNFDATYMTKSGTESASAAGSYSLTFSLKDTTNIKWADGSVADYSLAWSIGMTQITAPSMKTTKITYSGSEKSAPIKNYDSDTMTISGDTTAINAGTYSVTVALKDKATTTWLDNSTDDKTLTWTINRKTLTAAQSTFAQDGTLTYNATRQTVTISGFNENYHSLGGTTATPNAGTYTAKVYPQENYRWNDGTTDYKAVTWTIEKAKLAKPYAEDCDFIYDKASHLPTIINTPPFGVSRSGNYVAKKDVGEYAITYKIIYTYNVVWADDSTAPVVINWRIAKRTFAKPYAGQTTFTYSNTGAAQTLSVTGYDPDFMTISGTVEATDAGSYSVTYALKDKELYQWDDETTDDVTIDWVINRKALAKDYDNLVIAKKYSADGIDPIVYTGSEINLNDLTNWQRSYIWVRKNARITTVTLTLGGTTQATAAGSYTCTLTPTANYTWPDGSTNARSFSWTIEPCTLAAVSVDSDLTYNGLEQSPTITNYVAAGMTLESRTSATNAGTYFIKVTPNENYIWEDGSTSTVTLHWRIRYLALDASYENFTRVISRPYTGSPISLTSADFNIDTEFLYRYFVDGTSQTDIGYYSFFSVRPKANYCWADGSITAKYCYLAIYDPDEDSSLGIKLPIITSEAEFTYNGAAQSISVNYNSNFSEVKTGYLSATDAGDYSVTFALKGSGYTWKDGSTDDKTLTWKINRKPLSETQSDLSAKTVYFNRSIQTATITNFDANVHEKGGTYQAVNAGSYSITVAPKANYAWDDGSTAAKTITWKIVKKPIFNVKVDSTSFEYTGSDIALNVISQNYAAYSADIAQVGTDTAINAGTYTAIYQLTDKDNTQWWDGGTTGDISITWTIAPVYLEKPVLIENTFIYDGTTKSATASGYDSNTMTRSIYVQIHAGTFFHTYSLKDTDNYRWADGSTDSFKLAWRIKRAALTSEQGNFAQSNALTYNGNAQTPTFTNYDSTCHILTVTEQINAGEYSATIESPIPIILGLTALTPLNLSLGLSARLTAPTQICLPKKLLPPFLKALPGILSVKSATAISPFLPKIPPFAPPLLALSIGFSFIQKRTALLLLISCRRRTIIISNIPHAFKSQSPGRLAVFPGMKLPLALNLDVCNIGDVKEVALSGSFGGVNINGTFGVVLIGFNHNSQYEGSNRAHFAIAKSGTKDIAFVDSAYGSGAASSSSFTCYSLVESGGGSSLDENFLPLIDSDLAAYITACTKYGYLTTPYTHKLWLLSKFEIDGDDDGWSYNQAQYEYFENGNGLVRYKHSATSTKANWWTRTIYNGCFYVNSSNSTVVAGSNGNSYGIVPCFTIS